MNRQQKQEKWQLEKSREETRNASTIIDSYNRYLVVDRNRMEIHKKTDKKN